jgi:cell division protein FtsB
MLKTTHHYLNELMHRPVQVFWICFAVAMAGILVDGTAFRLWSLKRDHRMMSTRILDARSRSKQLEFRIQKAQQPEFIEKAARDQFDLVKEGDLVFIFSDENSEAPEKTTGIID